MKEYRYTIQHNEIVKGLFVGYTGTVFLESLKSLGVVFYGSEILFKINPNNVLKYSITDIYGHYICDVKFNQRNITFSHTSIIPNFGVINKSNSIEFIYYTENLSLLNFLFESLSDYLGIGVKNFKLDFYTYFLYDAIKYFSENSYIDLNQVILNTYPNINMSFKKILESYNTNSEYTIMVLNKYFEIKSRNVIIKPINTLKGVSDIKYKDIDKYVTILSAMVNFGNEVDLRWSFKRLCLEYDKVSKYEYLKSIEYTKHQKLIMSDEGKSFLKAYSLTPFDSIYDICEYGVLNGNCLWDYNKSGLFEDGENISEVFLKTSVGSIIELKYDYNYYKIGQHLGKFNSIVPSTYDVCVTTDLIQELKSLDKNILDVFCEDQNPDRGLTNEIKRRKKELDLQLKNHIDHIIKTYS